jgi:hypothetical protein
MLIIGRILLGFAVGFTSLVITVTAQPMRTLWSP